MKRKEQSYFELLATKIDLEAQLAATQNRVHEARRNDAADLSALPPDTVLWNEDEEYDGEELKQAVVAAANTFIDAHERDFWPSAKNLKTLTTAMKRRKLDPTKVRNYEIAWKLLKEAGVLCDPLSQQELDRMTSAEFMERLKNDPEFAQQVERLK